MKHARDLEKYFDAEHLCLNEAQNSIAQGALTNSKRLESYIAGVFPSHVVSGNQEYLYDFEGNQFIDYVCGLGTNYFGYTNPDITLSIQRALLHGITLSLGTPSEVEFARLIKGKFPYIDKIKALKSGSEGCSAALRIARTYTNRCNILTDGYHGWHDEFTCLTPPAHGIPPESHYCIQCLDIGAINENTAAVIIEPVILDWSEERRQFLNRLREECTKNGTLLIFDETITAYRFPKNSVANYWGIEPDLTVMGKALGNGMPISIVGGKKEIMDNEYFVSSTFAGERLSLEAAIAGIKQLNVHYNPDNLWNDGSQFYERMNEVLYPLIRLKGYPTRGAFEGDKMARSLFIQEMCKMGFLFHPSTWFYNKHLHKHLDNVIDCSKSVIKNILSGSVRLEGAPFQSPIKKVEYK